MARSIEELRKAEAAKVDWLQRAENVLMMADHPRHPEGEAWYTSLAKFRERLQELREIRSELVEHGQDVATCQTCGSTAVLGGLLHNCDDCRLHPEGDSRDEQLDRLLMDQGWARLRFEGGGPLLIVRAGDTPAPGVEGAPAVPIGDGIRLIGLDLAARNAFWDVKAVFQGAKVIS